MSHKIFVSWSRIQACRRRFVSRIKLASHRKSNWLVTSLYRKSIFYIASKSETSQIGANEDYVRLIKWSDVFQNSIDLRCHRWRIFVQVEFYGLGFFAGSLKREVTWYKALNTWNLLTELFFDLNDEIFITMFLFIKRKLMIAFE